MDAYGNYTAGLDSLVPSPASLTSSPVYSGAGVPDVQVDVPDWVVAYVNNLNGDFYVWNETTNSWELVSASVSGAVGVYDEAGGIFVGGVPTVVPTTDAAVCIDNDGTIWTYYLGAWH